MTLKAIAQKLRELDKAWLAAGLDSERARKAKGEMADYISENLAAIVEKLES